MASLLRTQWAPLSCRSIAPHQIDSRLSDPIRFSRFARSLGTSLQPPETRQVRSRTEIHQILGYAHGSNTYTLFPPAVDERESMANKAKRRGPNMPVTEANPPGSVTVGQNTTGLSKVEPITLPRPTLNETFETIANLDIPGPGPWHLQRNVGGNQYVAHALIVEKELKILMISRDAATLFQTHDSPFSFVSLCSPSSRLAFSSPAHSGIANTGIRTFIKPFHPLFKSVSTFIKALALRLSQPVTCHLNLTFVVEITDEPVFPKIYPISCNTTASPYIALVALKESNKVRAQVVDAYMAATSPLNSHGDMASDQLIAKSERNKGKTEGQKVEQNEGLKLEKKTGKSEDYITLPQGDVAGVFSFPMYFREMVAAPARNMEWESALHGLCGLGLMALGSGRRAWCEVEDWAWVDHIIDRVRGYLED